MKTISLLLVTVFTLSILGCEGMTTEQKTAATGALVGAAVGGVIGSKSANAGKGILIGAAAGAAGGYLVGKVRASKEEGQPATVVCPHCQTVNELPANAGVDDIIECHNCAKQFQLK
jgi:uncharacterized protein YcfJ